MLTIQYTDLLLTILTLCGVTLTVAVVGAAVRARRLAARLDRVLDQIEPRLPRLGDDLEATVQSTRRVAESAGRISDDLEAVSGETRQAAMPAIGRMADAVENVTEPLRHLSALVTGARAGLSALGGGNGPRGRR